MCYEFVEPDKTRWKNDSIWRDSITERSVNRYRWPKHVQNILRGFCNSHHDGTYNQSWASERSKANLMGEKVQKETILTSDGGVVIPRSLCGSQMFSCLYLTYCKQDDEWLTQLYSFNNRSCRFSKLNEKLWKNSWLCSVNFHSARKVIAIYFNFFKTCEQLLNYY